MNKTRLFSLFCINFVMVHQTITIIDTFLPLSFNCICSYSGYNQKVILISISNQMEKFGNILNMWDSLTTWKENEHATFKMNWCVVWWADQYANISFPPLKTPIRKATLLKYCMACVIYVYQNSCLTSSSVALPCTAATCPKSQATRPNIQSHFSNL